MKEGRSRILIIRTLKRKGLQESTVKRVLSLITSTHKKYGEEAAEEMATKLMKIVDSSETEAGLLKTIRGMESNTASASHPTKMQNEDMFEQMTLEDYKQKVEQCLLKTYNCTTQETSRLMTLYEDDFQEALSKFSWSPKTMALAMQKGY